MQKYYALLDKINQSNLSDEQKQILIDKLDAKIASILCQLELEQN